MVGDIRPNPVPGLSMLSVHEQSTFYGSPTK
jgi:hypothetical protein